MNGEENIRAQQEIDKTLAETLESAKIQGGEKENKVYPAYDTLELYEKVLINTPTGGEIYDELKPYMATAYFDRDELNSVRRIHSILVQIEHITETLKRNLKGGYKTNGKEMSDLKENLLRKLFFIAYSSKSKNGFTVLELNSQHTYRHENLYQKQAFDEEEGPLAGIKEKIGQAVDKGMNSNRKVWPEEKKSNELW